MPGLPKRASWEIMRETYGAHKPDTMEVAPPPQPSFTLSLVGGIKYIPTQQDPMAASTTSATRQSPIRLLFQDAGVLFRLLPYLPNVILPFRTKDPTSELYLSSLVGVRDMILQSWLLIIETALLLFALPAILILPGIVSMTGFALSCLIIWLISKPMEGPRIVYSSMNDLTRAMAEQHRDERWLFVNGCITSHSGLQNDVNRIAKTFGRAVIGIHNVTYGLPADLIECLVQRCFAYSTMDVRITYSYVKATLVDPTVSKVVLIGHSQGGIIVSLVIDQLFTELPATCMSKLEIYTFGSAASHFSNPLVSISSNTGANELIFSPPGVQSEIAEPSAHIIPHIEHYANEKDMVPRWGVLHCVQDVLNNRYAGSVFVRMSASGHLFNQHYMEPMFPLPAKETHCATGGFLDTIVKVDAKLAIRRESTAVASMGYLKKQSSLEFGSGQSIPDDPDLAIGDSVNGIYGSGDAFMTFARTNSGRLMAEEAQGKSVRELSRLWRYQGGRSPHTPSPFQTFPSEDRWIGGMELKHGGDAEALRQGLAEEVFQLLRHR